MIDKKTKSIYNKRYYQKKRKQILNYLNTRIMCECGCNVSRAYMYEHVKSKKHKILIQNTNN